MNFATTKLNGVSTITSSVTHTFLENMKPEEGQKKEYLLPNIVAELLEKEAASVKVLSTSDKWIGITYKEDIEPAQESFSRMITAGCYPENLWI